MSNDQYRICKRCVMDTTDPGIYFDEDGICSHCSEFFARRGKHKYNGAESDAQLRNIVDKIKKAGRNNEFDCVMGLSGGVDSSYTAYMAKKLGLRVLAVHLDNGWNAEEAVKNIKKITRKLGIEYQSFVLDWEEFKDIQLSFLKASVPEAETPTDIAIPGALHKVASQCNVKFILSGGNIATEGILPKHWHYNAKDLKYFNAIHGKYGTRRIRTFPTFGFQKEFYYKMFRGIVMVYLLNYLPYEKDEAMKLLQTELDWVYYGSKHYESKYTAFVQSYYLYEKFAIDYRRATFSTQICSGVMKRDEAMELLETKPYSEENIAFEKEFIARKLGVSGEEFEAILTAPPRWYSDYPNDENRLGFIYDTYRRIFKKEKLANF